MSELMGQFPSTERAESAVDELFDRRRLLLILGVLIVELVIFASGLLTPLSSSVQQSLQNQTNTQFGAVPTATAPQLVSLIFTHNLAIGLIEMIPVLGALVFVYSIYITGLVAQVIAVSAGYPSQFGVILFAFPYSLVELSAYAIAVGSGIMLLVSVKRKRFRRELRVFLLEMAAVAVVLLAAALMETATRFSPLIGFSLWIPTGLAAAGIIVHSRRRRT
jgi:uncharacterized membrane protein SpoIIM required for sporulation